MEYLEKISIILVEPQSPGNVGMVCRAMKNMGLTDLRLVNPCQLDHPEAQKFAVSAKEMLQQARIFNSLSEALADIELSVATTRRHGKYRQEIYTPEDIVNKIFNGLECNRAALVFGREDNGLSTDEVAKCRWHATIPTADEYGSLNLAQAVLVFCYEISKGIRNNIFQVGQSRQLAANDEKEALFTQMKQTLLRIGFLNKENPDHVMRSLRRVFARSELDSREVAILRGMMSQIDWASNEYRGKKGV